MNNSPFPHSKNLKTLYHGSPIVIKDVAMASGTYFTEDIDIARWYGDVVYSIEVDDKVRSIFVLDSLGEHFVSVFAIPLYLFDVLN